MDPNINDPALWRALKEIFGPGGIALLIAFGASLYFNRMQWLRATEKDATCQKEKDSAEERFQKSRSETRDDVKQAFGQVAELTKQVTLLAERTTSTRTRSD